MKILNINKLNFLQYPKLPKFNQCFKYRKSILRGNGGMNILWGLEKPSEALSCKDTLILLEFRRRTTMRSYFSVPIIIQDCCCYCVGIGDTWISPYVIHQLSTVKIQRGWTSGRKLRVFLLVSSQTFDIRRKFFLWVLINATDPVSVRVLPLFQLHEMSD